MRGAARVDVGNGLLSSELNPGGIDGGEDICYEEGDGGEEGAKSFRRRME